jgi:hypothetical protein
MVEEFIEPQLNEQLRYKILWDLFSQWLKLQLQEFEVKIDSIEIESANNLTKTQTIQ